MTDVVILQRLVPHYRVRVFEELYRRFGWQVACSKGALEGEGFNLCHNLPFAEEFDFKFLKESDPHRVSVPLAEIISRLKPKVIIAELSMRMSSTYGLCARRLFFRKPSLVFWSQGYNMELGLYGIKNKLRQLPRTVVSRFADAHVVYSLEGKRFLSNFFPPEKIFVAQNNIDIDPIKKYRKEIPAEKQNSSHPELLSIGRFTPDKDFVFLVRAFRKVLDVFPKAKLSLIGDGPDKERVIKEAADFAGKSIEFPGKLYKEEDLASYFNKAHLAVFPGSVGLSVNHALAYGVPVIAFDNGVGGVLHHPEICYVIDGVTGKRVQSRTPDALASAIIELFANDKNPKVDFQQSIERHTNEHMNLEVMLEGFEALNRFLDREFQSIRET